MSSSVQTSVGVRRLDLGTRPYREVNAEIRSYIAHGETQFDLRNVLGQRYLACAAPKGVRIEIHGTPGNDMGSYMDGAEVEVFGNAQDQVANTMNDGSIVVHGLCGDAAGYGMRGGSVFIEGNCGWRVGIHMKHYREKIPTIFIGGDAGAFLGEYMAGGRIILLGNPGEYLATGMHGGVIYLRNRIEESQVSWSLIQEPVDAQDIEVIQNQMDLYEKYFGHSCCADPGQFYRLRPKSQRPYGSMYA